MSEIGLKYNTKYLSQYKLFHQQNENKNILQPNIY